MIALALRMWSLAAMLPVIHLASAASDKSVASVGKLRSDADAALVAGDLEGSIKLLNQVIQLEPKNERNFLKRYRAHLRKRK